MQKIAVLGSTGSVGVNTLEVIKLHPDRYRVSCLVANTNVAMMLLQCKEFRPEVVVMADRSAAEQLRRELLAQNMKVNVMDGLAAIDEVVSTGVDTVVAAIVGAAGLSSTLAATRAGCKVLVANKEPVVMLGRYIMDLAYQHGAKILPLDSEHNAIFQCLSGSEQQSLGVVGLDTRAGIKRILLTGSGGPFRKRPQDQLATVTPEEACAHPNWNMGRKISVDSATMMNKGLELIEACAIFGIDEGKVDIVIHPQSIVHSMVEYIDGSILAQMANPDMKVPIANALAWPHRIGSGATSLDLFQCARFDFEAPDTHRFPSLDLARSVAREGGTAPCIMNAANEVAVDAFLHKQISFDRITPLVAETLDKVEASGSLDLDVALQTDAVARDVCVDLISKI